MVNIGMQAATATITENIINSTNDPNQPTLELNKIVTNPTNIILLINDNANKDIFFMFLLY